ncbi:MAG: Uma2 family endonuclease [Blastocatellia bacterium]
MSVATVPVQEVRPFDGFVIDFKPLLRKINDDDFFEFCMANRDWRIECTEKGDLIVMPPTGGDTGGYNFNLDVEFGIWSKQDGTGKGFDSSTVFKLPSGAKRSPDLSWVKRDRWDALTDEERRKFPPLCPEFVVELRSPSDSLTTLKDKMEEYIENGAQLGWLIDPIERKVYVYRPNVSVECLEDPVSLSGEPLLEGLVLEMKEVWG